MSVKQVLVIRKDLNMRKGKIASQAAHASMKAILDLMVRTDPCEFRGHRRIDFVHRQLETTPGSPLEEWLSGAFTKICVSVNSEQELLDLHQLANKSGFITGLIQDNGTTEFGGVPTYTALAIGPHFSDQLDTITGHLKLL